MTDGFFSRFAHWTGLQLGKSYTFAAACLLIIMWAGSGPLFHYSDTWQLVINTGTTIITFLMVFLLQHTQNRDTRVIQLKLDELIRSNDSARNTLLGLEDLTEREMARIKGSFDQITGRSDIPAELKLAQAGLEKVEEGISQAQEHVSRAVIKSTGGDEHFRSETDNGY
jgi:low affinity Fe/Cu permease